MYAAYWYKGWKGKMEDSICRAFTFINYHIPLTKSETVSVPYLTLGFFDGMFTERVKTEYKHKDLKSLWKYTIKRTQDNKGKYSCQHIFGFSKDNWNKYSDESFWSNQEEINNPLVFVVLLQVRQYMSGIEGAKTIKKQCEDFGNILNQNLIHNEKYYIYGTLDKNDYIVCIRGRQHKKVLRSIKQLHNAGCDVVYSYSILSVQRKVLDNMTPEEYSDIYHDTIDSICLKGVTNSRKLQCDIPLDKRYNDFCQRLIKCIYYNKKIDDNKVYDILGDDDFRLIARNVSLGALLKEFAQGGMLGYDGDEFRFYLFSSSLILNTLTPLYGFLTEDERKSLLKQKDNETASPICDELTAQMAIIQEVINTWEQNNYNEKILTFCQALWQLLQSLKVLEMAPTKKYDFYSLYHPFSALVRILETKLAEKKQGSHENIEEDKGIYEYIHKISMTLHGSFRTDIQFFQVRDFNVIVHYTPAKLRAFYSYWTFEISDFYNAFSEIQHTYSFIFSPGMFQGVNVDELFAKENEKERLMLITTPERLIYAPQWMLLVIGHEVSHFVGTDLRKREIRQSVWLNSIARIMQLEWICCIIKAFPENLQKECMDIIATDSSFYKEFSTALQNIIAKEISNDYHSKITKKRIKNTFRHYENVYLEKFIYDYCGKFRNTLSQRIEGQKQYKTVSKNKINDICRSMVDQLRKMYEKLESSVMEELLGILHYYVSESQADIIAIISMGISPIAYIRSFAKIDNIHDIQNTQGDTCMSVARIGIVMKVIEEIVKEEKEWFKKADNDFFKSWSGNISRNTRSVFPKQSADYQLATLAFGYQIHIKDYQKYINIYKKIYNEDSDIQSYSNKTVDFMNDQYIYDELCNYGKACARHYIKSLKKDDGLLNTRTRLQNTYKIFAGDSVLDAIQEMETFLAKYEINAYKSGDI